MSRVSLGTYRSWPSAVAISMSVIGAQAYSRLPSRSPVRVAERVGFEPTVAINHTAFRERHLQPLGHLSGTVEYRGGLAPDPAGSPGCGASVTSSTSGRREAGRRARSARRSGR